MELTLLRSTSFLLRSRKLPASLKKASQDRSQDRSLDKSQGRLAFSVPVHRKVGAGSKLIRTAANLHVSDNSE